MSNFKYYIISLLAFTLFTTSCHKDKDIDNPPVEINEEALNVNTFILENMNDYYLWTDNIPDDLDPKSTENSIEFFEQTRYRGDTGEYDAETGIYKNGDPWSFITDDLQGLIDYFNGVRKSTGYYLYAYSLNDGTDNFALVVAYVYANSPASEAGLKRGSVIMKIDGEYVNQYNANELLSRESYDITLGSFDFINEKFDLLDETKTITSVELNTNPIIKSEVYDINGTKVAYLLYNSFIHNYDNELIAEFEKYKSEGVTELVLDFRYNGGGSVASAINIASMIAPQNAIGSVFLKKMYNEGLQNFLINSPDYGQEFLEDNLSSSAYGYEDDGIVGSAMPNLDLNRVYVIGQEGTASASELVINGLIPYMNVITVGDRTHGKYVASITIENEKYTNWAIQPIVFKSANANDETDYWDGFEAQLAVEDHPIYGDFGVNILSGYVEPMLYTALSDIEGTLAKKQLFSPVSNTVVKMPVEKANLSQTMVYDIK
ncbi:MAG: S41 family peptidase [Bacteroidota bacterium]